MLLLGPDVEALSGISTHVGLLLDSPLAEQFELNHFCVGSEGLVESALRRLCRLALSPWLLLWEVAKRRPDIVHVNSATEKKAVGRDLLYMLVLRACRLHIVLQLHGGPSPQRLAASHPVVARALRLALRLADEVLLLAAGELRAFSAFSPGVRFSILPNAIRVAPPRPREGGDLRAGHPMRLLYVGRIVASKGLFEAVEAVAELAERGVAVTWSIAGSGPDAQRLADAVARHELQAQVKLLGAVAGEAKQALWAAADVFIFPSWREGLPYALLEAMAAGLVAVTSPVGGIPDLLESGTHGLLVDPHAPLALADALSWINEHREEAHRLGLAAQHRVARGYSLDRLAFDLGQVYDRLSEP